MTITIHDLKLRVEGSPGAGTLDDQAKRAFELVQDAASGLERAHGIKIRLVKLDPFLSVTCPDAEECDECGALILFAEKLPSAMHNVCCSLHPSNIMEPPATG